MAFLDRLRVRAFGKERGAAGLAREEAWMWLEATLSWVPGRVGRVCRGVLYGKLWDADGPMDVCEGTHIRNPEKLKCGRRVVLARGVQLTCGGGVTIGDGTMIGPGAFVISNGHRMDRLDVPMIDQGLYSAPIDIGEDVWIGANAVILPGVRIGKGAVVAAGAVVTTDIPAYAVAAGVPARVVKMRDRPRDTGEA